MATRVSISIHGSSPDLEIPEDIIEGVTILDHEKIFYFDADGLADLNLVIEITRGVALPLLAMWIYDKFIKKDSKTIAKETKINEKVITFVSRDEFIQLVQREIEKTEE
jgi:hypothetical protein